MTPTSIKFVLVLLLHLHALTPARASFQIHPRKMLLISYTVTSTPTDDLPRNPITNRAVSFRFFTIHRIVRPVRFFSSSDEIPSVPHSIRIERSTSAFDHMTPHFGIPKSIHDRAKDIFVVMIGFVFGVGCGVLGLLAAVTMYLAWQMVLCRYEDVSGGYEYDEEEDEMEGYEEIDDNPKKTGYAVCMCSDRSGESVDARV